MKWKIGQELAGKTLNRFFKKQAPSLPASVLYRLIRQKKILVDGLAVNRLNLLLKEGTEVEIRDIDPKRPTAAQAPMVRLSILFEDESLLVLNKPRGLSVHSGKKNTNNTLIDILKAQRPKASFYLVHRLDRDTSGVFLVAKDRETAAALGKAFKMGQVTKTYLALVLGKPQQIQGLVAEPLDSKSALSSFRVIASTVSQERILSVIEVKTATGRKHQVRRHLASIGLPLAGDNDYGPWQQNRLFQRDFRIKGFLLHSFSLSLLRPLSKMEISFKAPLPKEWQLFFPNLKEGLGTEERFG